MEGYSDDELLTKFIEIPKDLRKVICVKGSDMDALENGQWLCRDPKQVRSKFSFVSQLTSHATSCWSFQTFNF